MEEGWGLGTRADLTWFPTIRFRSLRDGLYPGEHLAFPWAVGAPFLSHSLDLATVIAASDVRQVFGVSFQGLSVSSYKGRLGGGAGEPAVAFGGSIFPLIP